MTVSANRKYAPQTTSFHRSKRVRRFWGAMALALKETGYRPANVFCRSDATGGVPSNVGLAALSRSLRMAA